METIGADNYSTAINISNLQNMEKVIDARRETIEKIKMQVVNAQVHDVCQCCLNKQG